MRFTEVPILVGLDHGDVVMKMESVVRSVSRHINKEKMDKNMR